ncbi:diguanylate cyclase [Sphaerospermopsis aphanizomenoides BCCUSP55]|uniref:sensor domain-containing diguanylate cyclase n=1 Tax=Sphaerospermopsis aphanizomenoides TaxID=459663 RepID=UPI001906410D|nr:diguanylate cyclase [Sphaerospermopsis aphanizomenoides]MBK1988268.1 diguanylate cyclase [Sphaerospermopsis aphanizomenoides BCCUSP55]
MASECDLQLATTQSYLHSIERLVIVVQELSSAHTLAEITKIVSAAVRELTSSDGATFVLLDNGFCYYIDENAIAPLWKGQRFPLNTTISGWVIKNCQPGIIEDVSADPRSSYCFYESTFIKSMAMVPIGTKKGISAIGAIGTYWGHPHLATTEEVKLLQLLAESTAVAMENVQIYSHIEQQLRDRTTALENVNVRLQQEIQERKAIEAEMRRLSLTDELTGLHNRRGFNLLAEQQLRLAKRSPIYTSLMFIELNEFEQINQTFGEEMGQDAIVAVARLLKRSFRSSDTLGRIGEDEFAVLVQGYELTCEVIQNRVATNIDQFNQTQQLPFLLSVNIGIQSYDSSKSISLDDLITLAHIHIYQRKGTENRE